MKIIAVEPTSPLFGTIRKGFRLLTINGKPVGDYLDYRFKLSDKSARLEFEDEKGEIIRFKYSQESSGDLGLTFEEDKILICRNKCIFCFVHQQPKGMRRALYVRDDDYRLSFTHGNFISMSNLTEADTKRIIKQRLSPLYVSVHATDDALRQKIFGNLKLPPILPQMRNFVKYGIKFHTQIVVCPGVNDGNYLEKTVHDLFDLFPGVLTVGIVPVGLTRYRERLPQIRPFNLKGAEATLDYIRKWQKEFHMKSGSRFVFAADEFYILARRKFPLLSEYEDMAQFENGIGMVRSLLTDFNRKKRYLARLVSNRRIVALTGESAFETLSMNIVKFLTERTNIKLDISAVENNFWGRSVTVSGLLAGRDILRKLRGLRFHYDLALLPPNCLNQDKMFLDNISLEELRRKAGMEVKIGKYSFADTLKEALS